MALKIARQPQRSRRRCWMTRAFVTRLGNKQQTLKVSYKRSYVPSAQGSPRRRG
ncbi:hypothetical protein KCP73_05890 [Salmonella enterica subsp. enterica]|nr:hypothetical protein KCP73_05890 [Salmonella enterica subsp. enterica]